MRKHLSHWFHDESGQAIIEYVLLLFAAVLIMTSIKVSLKKITTRMWSMLGKKIAAPCPTGCDAGSDFDL